MTNPYLVIHNGRIACVDGISDGIHPAELQNVKLSIPFDISSSSFILRLSGTLPGL